MANAVRLLEMALEFAKLPDETTSEDIQQFLLEKYPTATVNELRYSTDVYMLAESFSDG